jgi:hypothetical protein
MVKSVVHWTSMKPETLTENIRVRISKTMKTHLENLANQRGPGTKLSDLAREAIHKTYFSRGGHKK